MTKIHNRYLTGVTWENSLTCDFSLDNKVDVWRINISLNLSLLHDFLTIINPDELARANRYLHLHDKNRFIISRGALRTILAKYLKQQPSAIGFEIGPDKKPNVKNINDHSVFYNVSHSGDWVVIAVSKEEIGADVEMVNQNFDYKDIVKEYFGPREMTYINEGQSVERFFCLWTRKEALVKATGKGLDDNIRSIPCLDGEYSIETAIIKSTGNWLVSSFELKDGYIASVATGLQTGGLTFWDMTF